MGKILRRFPVPFWCYFLPMLAGTFGLIPQNHFLYNFISKQFLPVCLTLLLIGTDLKAVARMGAPALGLMLAGSAGTALGGLASFLLYRRWLPLEAWGGIGALTASWTGGSANMIAVKEAFGVPDGIIGPLILVDAAVAYSWMALLIWSSSWQEKWDGWVGAAGDAGGRTRRPERERGRREYPQAAGPAALAAAILLAIGLSLSMQWLARRLPALGAGFNAVTWTVILVTAAALLLSLTPLRRLEQAGASRAGTLLLYLLLASIGARADLRAILHTPVFLALGATWIAIHGLVLLTAGRLARAPLGLIAAASQANIGGTVSAPMVGAAFSPQLASVGLLMAILGNLIGTPIGLAVAFMARKLTMIF